MIVAGSVMMLLHRHYQQAEVDASSQHIMCSSCCSDYCPGFLAVSPSQLSATRLSRQNKLVCCMLFAYTVYAVFLAVVQDFWQSFPGSVSATEHLCLACYLFIRCVLFSWRCFSLRADLPWLLPYQTPGLNRQPVQPEGALFLLLHKLSFEPNLITRQHKDKSDRGLPCNLISCLGFEMQLLSHVNLLVLHC